MSTNRKKSNLPLAFFPMSENGAGLLAIYNPEIYD